MGPAKNTQRKRKPDRSKAKQKAKKANPKQSLPRKKVLNTAKDSDISPGHRTRSGKKFKDPTISKMASGFDGMEVDETFLYMEPPPPYAPHQDDPFSRPYPGPSQVPTGALVSPPGYSAPGGVGSRHGGAPPPDNRQKRAEYVKSHYRLISQGDMPVYAPNTLKTYEDVKKKVRKVEVGTRLPGSAEKVIMIVGATGSGKSTTINGMFNYVIGMDWQDDYRLKLIVEDTAHNQANSLTSFITCYTIHHQPWFTVPYTLTIIDTPGFADTAGIERDQEITKQIQTFFQTRGINGIDHLDAVGFVAQAALPRLTQAQKYIFESILALFGKDIADNIIMLLTFADGQPPQVLAGIKEANLPYKKFFKFNNSALYVSNAGGDLDEDGEEENFDEMFWKMGKKSFKKFMTELGKLPSKSLLLTKEVLKERQCLEITVEGIQIDVKMGLNKLEQLLTECKVLDSHQADIDKNKDFTYTVNEQKIETVPTRVGQYTTNCLTCNRTCHEQCGIAEDSGKINCWAMTGGNCRICPKNCRWDMHRNHPHVYVIKIHAVTKTADDLKKRYQLAQGKKLTAQQIVKQCQNDFDNVQRRVLGMINQARKSIERLNEIALRPSPLSTVDYIDILIQGEKADGKQGWKSRVDQLLKVREKAAQMQALANKGYDPFKAMMKKCDDERVIYQQDLRKKFNLPNP